MTSLQRSRTRFKLACPQTGSAPPQYQCALGSLPHFAAGVDPAILIFVSTTARPPVGTMGTITVSAAPDTGQGTDTNTTNNSASTTVRFTGLAALRLTITPTAATVPLGAQTTMTVTIHNDGPQPAEQTSGVVEAGNADKLADRCCPFDITGFTGSSTPPGAGGHPAEFPTPFVDWYVGTLAPGSSISAILTVKARAIGTSRVGLAAHSIVTDPNCPNNDCPGATALIQAIAVRPTPTPTVTPTVGPAPLAATGPPSRALLGLSVLLLITGTTLRAAARRRTH
jgi:hypothetical protein